MLAQPITTNKIRVVINATADGTWSRITEIEAWTAASGGGGGPRAPELRYLHRDNLGSVTAITNETGAVVERLAYDPWGKRRLPNGSPDASGRLAGGITDRGYTLHEHLDEVGLVHMNARLYDPVLGRFTSADSIVDGVTELQGFNRYSYVHNNPVNRTDPTGHGWFGDMFNSLNPFSRGNIEAARNVFDSPFSAHAIHTMIHREPSFQITDTMIQRYPVAGQVLQVAAVVVVTYFTAGTGTGFSLAAFASITATAGASSALVANAQGAEPGAYWRAGLTSAATAAAFYGVGAATIDYHAIIKIGAHAAVGCASAALGGGECANGALSAAIGKSVSLGMESFFEGRGGLNRNSPIQNTIVGFVITSAAGGTASALTGGKFANGAMTAAFGYLLNQAVSAGVKVRFPMLLSQAVFGPEHVGNGFAFGVAASLPIFRDGEFDFGFWGQLSGGGDGVSIPMLGHKGLVGIAGATAEFGYSEGSVRNGIAGKGSELNVGAGLIGGSEMLDQHNRISGGAIAFGPNLGATGSGTFTGALTVRSISARIWDAIRGSR